MFELSRAETTIAATAASNTILPKIIRKIVQVETLDVWFAIKREGYVRNLYTSISLLSL